MNETLGTPFMDNPHVQEFLSVMRENGTDTANFMSMIGHVTAMENFLETATNQLTAMRQELY
jgi:uracil phosphoribosyltransferase